MLKPVFICRFIRTISNELWMLFFAVWKKTLSVTDKWTFSLILSVSVKHKAFLELMCSVQVLQIVSWSKFDTPQLYATCMQRALFDHKIHWWFNDWWLRKLKLITFYNHWGEIHLKVLRSAFGSLKMSSVIADARNTLAA